MRRSNRYVEAFKENYNTIGLASAAALSLATLSPIPLLVGMVAEAAYMLAIPDSKWYADRLALRQTAKVEEDWRKLRDQTLPKLRPELRDRYLRLEETRKQIETQSQTDKEWYQEVLRKLDYLQEKFLLFGGKESEFRTYLNDLANEIQGVRPLDVNAPYARDVRSGRDDIPRRTLYDSDRPRRERAAPLSDDAWVQRTVEDVKAHYVKERGSVEKLLEAETSPDTKAVLEKRVAVLQRREEFADKMAKILGNINHQLQLVEDTFGLINDEIRARSPEQLLADIEEVVVATNSMSSALEELEPYQQMAARVS